MNADNPNLFSWVRQCVLFLEFTADWWERASVQYKVLVWFMIVSVCAPLLALTVYLVIATGRAMQ